MQRLSLGVAVMLVFASACGKPLFDAVEDGGSSTVGDAAANSDASVLAQGNVTIQPGEIDLSAPCKASATKTLTIRNGRANPITWKASSTLPQLLSLSQSSGTLASQETSEVTAQITYDGVLLDALVKKLPQRITVEIADIAKFEVVASVQALGAILDFMPPGANFNTTPSQQALSIRNRGSQAIAFAIETTPDTDFSVTPNAGTVSAGETLGGFTVAYNPGAGSNSVTLKAVPSDGGTLCAPSSATFTGQ